MINKLNVYVNNKEILLLPMLQSTIYDSIQEAEGKKVSYFQNQDVVENVI